MSDRAVGFAGGPAEGGDTTNDSETDGDLLTRIKRQFREARDASAKWRQQAREDFGFYSGEQWAAEDVATLRDQLRPVVTFNRVAPTIDTVGGMEVNNRQEIRCFPRSTEDASVSDAQNAAIKWVRDECDAEDEESDMFLDAVICGMGWTETRPDFDRDPDGMLVEERLDPLEMFWDAYARKRNLADARYIIHRKELDIEDARAMFPDADDGDLHAAWAQFDMSEDNELHDQTEARFYRNDQTERQTRRKVTILHVQWVEKEPFYSVRDPMNGQVTKLGVDQYQTVSERLAKVMPGIDLPAVKQQRRVIKRAFVGNVVLESGDGPCKDEFTFQCVTGKRDRNKRCWYGMVAAMKDPQRWANKFLSTTMHTMATSGKGIVADKDAFENPAKAESEWARPDAIVWTRPGAVAAGKIMPKPAGTLPPGIADLMMFALSSMRDVSGVNLEVLGQADRDQPASLEWQRRKAAFSILAAFFDALRHFRKRQGRLLIYMIREYISDGRLMRIEGQDGNPRYVPLLKDPATLEYDIVVDDAPSSPDQKEATWLMLSGMMPLLSRLPVPPTVWAELLKYSPLPENLTQKVAQIITSMPAQPDPKMIAAQAQVQALQAKTQIGQAQAAQELQLERERHAMQMQQDQQKAQQQIAVQAAQAQSEQAIEQARLAHDLQVQTLQAHNEMALEQAKARNQMDLAAQKFAEQKRQGAFKPRPSSGQ